MKHSSVSVLLLLVSATALLSHSSAATAQQQEARESARAAAIAASKAYGSQERVVIAEPARSYIDWGAIIQPNGEVLSVRANSIAAAMGVKVGDRLTHINDAAINPQELAATLAAFERLEHNEAFSVTVTRKGRSTKLSGTAQATVIPGWRLEVDNRLSETTVQTATATTDNSCGRISVFFTPPETRDFYPAFINTINGDNVRTNNPNFKLPTGQHQVGVHELISDPLLRRGPGIDQEKLIDITVESNTTYYIAAHFIREKRFSRRDGGYWEPVVWKVAKQSCVLN